MVHRMLLLMLALLVLVVVRLQVKGGGYRVRLIWPSRILAIYQVVLHVTAQLTEALCGTRDPASRPWHHMRFAASPPRVCPARPRHPPLPPQPPPPPAPRPHPQALHAHLINTLRALRRRRGYCRCEFKGGAQVGSQKSRGGLRGRLLKVLNALLKGAEMIRGGGEHNRLTFPTHVPITKPQQARRGTWQLPTRVCLLEPAARPAACQRQSQTADHAPQGRAQGLGRPACVPLHLAAQCGASGPRRQAAPLTALQPDLRPVKLVN